MDGREDGGGAQGYARSARGGAAWWDPILVVLRRPKQASARFRRGTGDQSRWGRGRTERGKFPAQTMNSVIFPLDLRPSRPRLSQCSMKIDDDSHLVYGSPSTHILKNPTLKKKQISNLTGL
ncbi:unnamed protein product [Urochloa humidicola]